MTVSAAPPAWWTTPGGDGHPLVDPAFPNPDPLGIANVGQGKYAARKALKALVAAVGENTEVQEQVVSAIDEELYKTEEDASEGVFYPLPPDEPTAEWIAEQHAPLQIGALKALAAPFYRHLSEMNGNWVKAQLIENGLTLNGSFFQDTDGTYFPWNPADNSNSEKNTAVATVGQLKLVFSLRFEAIDINDDGNSDSADENGDGIPDVPPANPPGVPNGVPTGQAANAARDTDGDGITDADETVSGTNPNLADTDGDGLTDAEEIARGTIATDSDSDDDDMPDGEDADPRDKAVAWKISPEFRYAFQEVEGWTLEEHGYPIMTNKKGQLLCGKAVWKEGTWTHLQGAHYGTTSSSVTISNTYQGHSTQLFYAGATSISDDGEIAGYATGSTTLGYYGRLPLVWSSASDGNPTAVGIPGTLPNNPYDLDAVAYLARNGNAMTLPSYRTYPLPTPMALYNGPYSAPISSAPYPALFGGLGRDGTSCGTEYDENSFYGPPWVWLGSDGYGYMTLSSSNTVNPYASTGDLDFDADIYMMGSTPPAGQSGVERPVVSLGGETLIYNGDKWVRSLNLQHAVLSASGTALTYDDTEPAVWRNGKIAHIKDLCRDLEDEDITSFLPLDINDDGVILIKETSGSERIGLLIPAAVSELAPKLVNDRDVAIQSSKYPTDSPKSTWMVERDPDPAANLKDASEIRTAWRDMKVKIGKAYSGKTVNWSLEALFVRTLENGNQADSPAWRGSWSHAQDADYQRAFSVSEHYEALSHDFHSTSTEAATTLIDTDGYTAIRVNLAPIGFNKARVKIQFEILPGKNVDFELIDLEVPAIIVVDPGHGGIEPASVPDKLAAGYLKNSKGEWTLGGSATNHATSYGSPLSEPDPKKRVHTLEKDLTLAIGLPVKARLKELCETQNLAARIVMTREVDENLTLGNRANMAKNQGADVFFSLHFNGGATATRGSEVWVEPAGARPSSPGHVNENNPQDRALGKRILDSMVGAIPEGSIREYSPGAGPKEWADDATRNSIPTDTYCDRLDRLGNEGHMPKSRGCLAEIEYITNPSVETALISGPDAATARGDLSDSFGDAILEDIKIQE